MILYNEEKTAIFIDGSNMHYAMTGLRIKVDYKKVRDYFQEGARVVKMFYYTAMLPNDGNDNPLVKLTDWLAYNGYIVRQKEVKEFTREDGSKVRKGNMDIEIAVDAMRLIPHVDHFVLFTGDGDFCYLVEALQQLGKRVTVISTIRTKPAVCSDDLRKAADEFIDLDSRGAEQWLMDKRVREVVPQEERTEPEPVVATKPAPSGPFAALATLLVK